ncbi:MAG: efflux RND transporter periplasmic adaptor subunit, partial [Ignavibacteriales bacterium]|nr:efflux RND transporter periplasmic adaptor subunit [Ignavibacteriales bacterium]
MSTNIKLLAVFIVFAFTFLGCSVKENPQHEEKHDEHSEAISLSAEALKDIQLTSETVTVKPFTGYMTIPASVMTDQDNEAQIGSLVQGRVHQVFVKTGDYVKAGQLLMTVEGLDVGRIKSDFLKAKASLDYTKANYERQKKLYDEKIGSLKSVLEGQTEYEKAMAEYKAEDKKIHSVGLKDDDITDTKKNDEHTSGTLPIKSPINGVVVERNIVTGQLVDATTNAFKVINTNTIWVDGRVYEKDLAKINRKTSAVFTSGIYPGESFNGSIIYIGQTIDELTRTILVRGDFNNPGNKLKPHMFGELKVPVGPNATAILIPEEAVVKEAGDEYVFVQTGDTTFEHRAVLSGAVVDNRIEIKEGLREGEKVVVKGVFYLKSEMKKAEIAGDE